MGTSKAVAIKKPEIGEDILAEARKMIGLFPVKLNHILNWSNSDYAPCADDIPSLEEERRQAALNFLHLTLNYRGNDLFSQQAR